LLWSPFGRVELPAPSDVEPLPVLPAALPQQLRLIHERRPGERLVNRIIAVLHALMPSPGC
jgi:hypothetical protein